ncbi:Ankyrin repeat and SAM domain-containing protein [Actinidia chinensis var. chinensis]|uniref:Ankyrin repeat and SAM domain-containing protein n=1 Tax=Actinidia chinensis var. chinensis TaxID=1590841 RepID=A0A2R6QJS4_ACTCC|nr:Ankyrin repeat and SAM domain-containing protein [Actinidia chinensis var. chinensis]
MYADRVDAASGRSIKERLNGNTIDDSGRRRQITGKRQRQDDDKWQHDLYKDDEPQVSNRRIGTKDLRFKLQKKSIQKAIQSGIGNVSGVRDLREKLSGTIYALSGNTDPPKPKPKPVLEGSKRARTSAITSRARINALIDAPEPETKGVASSVPTKKTQQKAESVYSFLQSLGLEKYSITFQAEEVDMTALLHMTDGDLKALGVPMGPRKKILLALESEV